MKKQILLFLSLLISMPTFCMETPSTEKVSASKVVVSQPQKKSFVSRNKGKIAALLSAMTIAGGLYQLNEIEKQERLARDEEMGVTKRKIDAKKIDAEMSALEKALEERAERTTDEHKKAIVDKLDQDLEKEHQKIRLQIKDEKERENKVLGSYLENIANNSNISKKQALEFYYKDAKGTKKNEIEKIAQFHEIELPKLENK